MPIKWLRLCLVAFVFFSSALGTTSVTWKPHILTVSILSGTSKSVSVEFSSRVSISNADVRVVPELLPYISVISGPVVSLRPASSSTLLLRVNIPKGTPSQKIQGVIQIGTVRTIAEPLPVILEITTPSSMIVPTVPSLPSYDRVDVISPTAQIQYVSDEVDIYFKLGTSDSMIQQVVQSIGGAFIGSLPVLRKYQISVPVEGFSNLQAIISSLAVNPAVDFAIPHLLNHQNSYPNDPCDALSYAPDLIHLRSLWNNGITGSPQIKVGIIDGVFDIANPDLYPNIVGGLSSGATLLNSHGTRVASIVGAVGNNFTGIAGVMWNPSLYLYDTTYLFDVAKLDTSLIELAAIDALNHRVNLINYSAGANCQTADLNAPNYCTNDLMAALEANDKMFRNLIAAGQIANDVTWIFATANNRSSFLLSSPARLSEILPNVISVGSVDSLKQKAYSSAYGSGLSLYAPGEYVYSDVLGGSCDNNPTGTSFAAPFVTGVAGLMISQNPKITSSKIKNTIIATAQPTGNHDPEGNQIFLLDASAAVQSASNMPTFTEAFDHAPDYSNNWILWGQHGTPTVTYTAGNFRIQADPICTGPTTGTDVFFRSKQAFVGDLDASFELNHAGFGRTSVGLISATQNQGVIWSVLDTDDTNYLDLVSGPNATEWKYAGSPYMNRWITLRIQVVGDQVNFYADDPTSHGLMLLQTWPVPISSLPDSYYLVFGAGSVCWKSGANDTSFRLIKANGTLAP